MVKSSEAKSYVDIKSPLKEKPRLEVVKEEIPEVPQKVQRKIAKKVAACVSAGIVASTGGFIAFGESGNLPEHIQEWYDETSQPIRKMFGIEVAEETPDVVIHQETVQSQVQEPEKTQETTSPVVEEISGLIEDKGIMILAIEGLRYDKEINTFFAQKGNPYGLEAETKAGVFIKDAFEFNGKMENSIGLDPKIIEFKEKETFKETKERLLPIFINLTTAKDVKIQELNEAGTEIGRKVLGFNVSVGTEFLTPLSGSWGMFKPFPNVEDKCFFTDWDIGSEGQLGGWEVYLRDTEILAKMKRGTSILNPKAGDRQTLMETEVKLGDLLGKITSDTSLEEFSKSGWGDYQIVTFLKNKDRMMEVGSGTSACKVFVLTTAEIEKINAPEIEGLSFEQKTRTYIAEAGNPYGLEAGVEAGIYVEEAVEINGKIEDSIGFKPEVIEVLQKNIYENEEIKEYLCSIPFNLKEVSGIEIRETEPEEGAPGYVFLGMKIPLDSYFYIPATGNWLFLPEASSISDNALVFDYSRGVDENDFGTKFCNQVVGNPCYHSTVRVINLLVDRFTTSAYSNERSVCFLEILFFHN